MSRNENPFAELIDVLKSNGYTSAKLADVPGPFFFNLLHKAGWKEAWSGAPGKSTHIFQRLKERGPTCGITTLRDFATFLERGVPSGASGWLSPGHGAKVIVNWNTRGFVTFVHATDNEDD